MNACLNNKLINLCNCIKSFLIHTRNYLLYCFEAVNLIPGVNSFGAVTDFEILTAFKPRLSFKYRHTNFLGNTGINSAFKNYNRAFCKVSAHYFTCSLNRRKVRRVVVIYRCRNCYNMEFRFTQSCFIGSKINRAIFYSLVADLVCRIDSVFIKFNLFCIKVKTNNLNFF